MLKLILLAITASMLSGCVAYVDPYVTPTVHVEPTYRVAPSYPVVIERYDNGPRYNYNPYRNYPANNYNPYYRSYRRY
jgi:hypothetical protein